MNSLVRCSKIIVAPWCTGPLQLSSSHLIRLHKFSPHSVFNSCWIHSSSFKHQSPSKDEEPQRPNHLISSPIFDSIPSEDSYYPAAGKPNIPITAYETSSSYRNFKMSQRKVNLVAKLIRKLPVEKAKDQLQFLPKKAVVPLSKCIQTAMNHAKLKGLNLEKLYVSEAYVTRASQPKQIRYHGRGRCGIMHRRHCHMTVRLRECETPMEKIKKKRREDSTRFYTMKPPQIRKIRCV